LVALANDQQERSLALVRSASTHLSPGVEQPYLVWYRHYLIAHETGAEDEARASLAEAHTILRSIVDGLDAEQRERALNAVPEHRAILDAWSRVESQQVPVTIPRAGVPLGRTLRPNDWIEVNWTISTPDDLIIDGEADRRRHRLVRLAEEAHEQGGAPRVEDFAAALGVSSVTIRRDLTGLRRAGRQIPTRGRRA
jgi:hypothetical protein